MSKSSPVNTMAWAIVAPRGFPLLFTVAYLRREAWLQFCNQTVTVQTSASAWCAKARADGYRAVRIRIVELPS